MFMSRAPFRTIAKAAVIRIDTTTTLADRYRARMTTAISTLLESVADSIPLKDLVTAIESGSLSTALSGIQAEQQIQNLAEGGGIISSGNSVRDVVAALVQDGARLGLKNLDRIPVQKRPSSIADVMRFDVVSQSVIDLIRRYTFELITGISAEMRTGIREIILSAFQFGGHPREQASQIRSLIGLTGAQVRAIANYRRMLDAGEYLSTLTRTLRDARYDATIRRVARDGATLTRRQISAMVQRYAERSLRYRALMIARTETIRAANGGQLEAWYQAQQQGLLPIDQRHKWLVATDERLCPSCRAVPGLNPGGVLLGAPFQSPLGSVALPPLHPNCRCSVGLVI